MNNCMPTLDNLDKMDKFLETCKFQKPSQKEIENRSKPITRV